MSRRIHDAGRDPLDRPRDRVELVRSDDARLWDSVLAANPARTPFHRWAWLSDVAGLLDLRFVPMIALHDDRPVGVVPLLVRDGRIRIAPPLPFPYIGPVVPDRLLAAALTAQRAWQRRSGTLTAEIQLGPGATRGAGGVVAATTRTHHEATFRVDLAGGSADGLWAGLSSRRRNAVRVAERRGVTVRRSIPGDGALLLPRVLDEAFHAHGRSSPYPASVGTWTDRRLGGGDLGAVTAELDGQPVGMLTLVHDDREGLGWIGGVLSAGRSANAGSALTMAALRWALEEGLESVDMVGEVDAGVASYKTSFGAQREPYLRMEISPLPTPALRLLRRVKAVTSGGRA